MVSSRRLCSLFILAFLLKGTHCQVDPTLDVNPNAPRTRGNRFALAFMNNNVLNVDTSNQQLGLFVTTEQESSTFTVQTRFPGASDSRFGFTETSPDSGIWSRTEVAVNGRFVFVNLPGGGRLPPMTGTPVPDIAVQNDGQTDEAERTKGVIVEAADPTHELTVYVLSDESVSTDAYMAINCEARYPSARDYQYFVFSSGTHEAFASRFLITFCEDNTQISIRPSQVQSHPDWVDSEFPNTDPRSTAQDETEYRRIFNRFDTIMLSNNADLTGSIIISNNPISVFGGHECGAPIEMGTCDYLVEQVPPHPTFGDLFYLAPFSGRRSGDVYRVGTLNRLDEVTVTINNCNCLPDSGDGLSRAALQGTGAVQTATIERGQYVQCHTDRNVNTQTYCSIESSNPVTVMAYTPDSNVDRVNDLPEPVNFNPLGDPAMVYIPPVTSYLNSYSATTAKNLTTQFEGFISWILPTRIFDNSEEDQNRFLRNGEPFLPTDSENILPTEYQPISCGNPPEICAYGANAYFGQGEFTFTYRDIGFRAFWGYVYGYQREVSFAYPLAFEMEPTGLAWVTAFDRITLESDAEVVTMGFEIVRGDRSFRTRAFAYTEGGSATEVEDYTDTGVVPGGGDSNLRWGRTARFPFAIPRNSNNPPFQVTIIDDEDPEPVEVIEVQLRCEDMEHCYAPRSSYTVTIIDDQGECQPLPTNIQNLLRIDYSFNLDPPFPRHPYGTVATYVCQPGFLLVGDEMRTCVNGVWNGTQPRCGATGAMLSFAANAFSYVENEGMGFLEFSLTQAFSSDIDFTITSVPTYDAAGVRISASALPTFGTFPAGQTTYSLPFNLVDDTIGLELEETYNLNIALSQDAINDGVSIGAGGDTASLTIQDDDLVTVSVAEPGYSVEEDDGFVEVSYVLNREALMDVTFSVENVDGSATGELVDYDSTGYTLTIPAGQIAVSMNITIVEDDVPGEGEEDFVNSITSVTPSAVSIGQGSSTVTIFDSDVAVPVMFDRASYTFSESGGSGTIRVVTDGRSAPFDFMFNVNGGPSTQPFVINSGGSINFNGLFPMGATFVDIPFTLTNDNVALEDVESYIASLTLATGTGAGVVLGSPDQATINVEDDDVYSVGFVSTASSVDESAESAVLEIESTPAVRDVMLSVGTVTGGTASSPDDYVAIGSLDVTIPAGAVTTSFNIDIEDDNIVEGDETIFARILQAQTADGNNVSISQPDHTVTILDNDDVVIGFERLVFSFEEGSGTGFVAIIKNGSTVFDYEIRVSGGPSEQTGIIINGDGINSTVTFPADQDRITIPFSISDDELGLEEVERYIASLELIGTPFGVVVDPDVAEVRVVDNDVVSVGFGAESVTVTEASGQFTMCVRLNRLSALDVVVNIESLGGTATSRVDYDPDSIPSEVTISAMTMETCFNGDILDDGVAGEGPESFMLRITGVGPRGVEIFRETTIINITDSDVGMCRELEGIPNGEISYSLSGMPVDGEMFVDGTIATYFCIGGYVLEGAPTRTCVVPDSARVGEFDGTEPRCVPVCDALLNISNGQISYVPDMMAPYSVNTVATYSCNDGYQLNLTIGTETRTCTDLGDGLGAEFDGSQPSCEPVCPTLDPLVNGMITYFSDTVAPYDVGTIATYSCNPGYELDLSSGDMTRTCMDPDTGIGGQFGGTAPTCQPVCPPLDTIDNGMISYAPDMMAPYDVNTVATYICNPGYQLNLTIGDETRTCTDLGTGLGAEFNGDEPSCDPVCPTLDPIDNGMITYSSGTEAPFSEGTIATYICDPGYELDLSSGDMTRTCMDPGTGIGGEFGGTAPTCQPVCPPLGPIDNGMISYGPDMMAPYSINTVATYSCDPGYELTLNPGTRTRTCMDAGSGIGGEFGGMEPTCRPLCPPLSPIDNGTITYAPDTTPDYEVGTVATHVCTEGFNLVGDATRVCQSDRTFSGAPPVCTLRPVCADLAPLVNGRIEYSEGPPRELGTVATHICDAGFFLNGVVTRTCVLDNTDIAVFDETAPTCDPIQCPALPLLENGVIEYSIFDIDVIIPVDMPPYDLGTEASHRCNPGYRLVGAQIRVCEDVGTAVGEWNESPPFCELITCADLPQLSNGVITYNMPAPRPVGTVATHVCNEGFELEGQETRTCGDDEMFSGQAPTCTPLCPALESLENGVIEYSSIDPDAPFQPIGTVAAHSCLDGYELEGPENRTCRRIDDNSADFDLTPPRCVPVCDELPEQPDLIIDYNPQPSPTSPEGGTATLTCRDGFRPVGPPGEPPILELNITLVCVEVTPGGGGEFEVRGIEGSTITCEPTCVRLQDIANGQITYAPDMEEPYNLGTIATYSCDEGYELDISVGDEMRTCINSSDGSGGRFDGQEPSCRPVCDPLEPIGNGMISYAPDMMAPYNVGTVATYTCNDGFEFEQGVGDQMRTCEEVSGVGTGGADFSGDPPRCVPIETNFTICSVDEPMMVSPFTRSTSYRFMGSCEHVLLRPCNQSISDFEVRMDFLTSSNEHGAVGVFAAGESCIITENGDFSSTTPGTDLGPNPDGNEEISYPDLNTIIEVGIGFIEIRVGGGIGVTVRYTGGDPPNVLVTVSGGTSLGETCGLCGTQNGELLRPDGIIADITNPGQVEEFTMAYLTPADQQALRPIRRECAMLRNDTIIGDPLYTVALTNNGPGPSTMCYEVRGSANQHYNLVSDTCVSVNALYSPMDEPEFGNIMSEIGVRAVPDSGFCIDVSVRRDGCAATATVLDQGFIIDSTFSMGGVSVRRYPNRVRISATNCEEVTLVMWVQCVTVGGQDMLHFVISRGVNLRATSHGLLGQFWNIPASAAVFPSVSGNFYTVTVEPSEDPQTHRSFLAESYVRTWDKRPLQCLYAGNSQGGPYNELQDSSAPSDTVIEGNYREYQVDFLHDSEWTYGQFEEGRCPVVDGPIG